MRKILIVTGRYLPGYRDGGPVRSIANLCARFGDEADIRIICLDRDHGDDCPYPGIRTEEYTQVKKAKVWYTKEFTAAGIRALADEADVIYVCGPYSDYARIAMRLKKKGIITKPLYVASMGSFSPGAFAIKGLKKRAYITFMKTAGYFRNVIWSVTSKKEEEELKKVVGAARCVIAEDLPAGDTTEHTALKEDGMLKMVFLSRISRKKNLSAIPDILRRTDDDIRIKLDIYGTCEDEAYLHECMEKLDALKKTHSGCKWEYKGEALPEDVPGIFAAYDAFLFPTCGENYGHVIAESLAAGCIPVISDTTPWQDLEEKGCGYVCGIDSADRFAAAIMQLYRMNETDFSQKREKCYAYIKDACERSVKGSGYKEILGIK